MTVVNIVVLKFIFVPCFQYLCFFCCLVQLGVYFPVDAYVLGNFLVDYVTIRCSSNVYHEVSWLVTLSLSKRAYLLEDHFGIWISSVM